MASDHSNGLVRVNFSTRGFAKLIKPDTLSPLTPNPQALIGVSRVLAGTKLNEEQATVFQSIAEFRGIDYVGYIIEKERLDKSTGTWKRLSEYHVIGAKSNSFKDSRVAYGETYRYRIRAVVKWTTYNNPDVLNNNQNSISILTNIQSAVAAALKVNSQALQLGAAGLVLPKNATGSPVLAGNVILNNAVNASNYFSFNITAKESSSRLATINTKLQAMLAQIASNKSLTDATLMQYTNELIASGVSLPAATPKYTSEYLVSYPSRNWQYVTVAEQVLPNPPTSIAIVPCTPSNRIVLYWLPPIDSQRDLAYIRLYRRSKLGDPWQLVLDNISLTESHYTDTDVTTENAYVYALSSVDLHGYESFLSTQIEARLNPSYESEKQERLLRWVSGAGARPDENDTVFKRFYDPFERLTAMKSIKISPSDTLAEDNVRIILRVKSLDTHETRDIKVNLRNITNS